MYYLGIDVGSSFLKCSVLDLENGKVLESSRVPTPGFAFADPIKKEIPMEALSHAVAGLIEEAAAKREISGVTFSVQMHGFMLFAPDGTPVTNYISWQDLRGTIPDETGLSVLEKLRGDEYAEYFAEDGVLLRPNHSIVPLAQYAKENAIAPGTQLALMGDALTRMLCGRRAPIHPTNAASSGMLRLSDLSWNTQLLEKLGLSVLDLPEVRSDGRPCGIYKSAHGEIPFYDAIGDQQATVYGIGAKEGDIFINIATGGQIGYVVRDPVPGPYETRPYFDGTFIRTITQLPSGRTINVLMRFLRSVGMEVFGETDEKAAEAKIWKYFGSLQLDCAGGKQAVRNDGALSDASGAGTVTAQAPAAADNLKPLQLALSYFDPDGGTIDGIYGENFTVGNLIHSAYDAFAEAYAAKAEVLGCGAIARAAEAPQCGESAAAAEALQCGESAAAAEALECEESSAEAEALECMESVTAAEISGCGENTGAAVICTGGVIRKNALLFARIAGAFSCPCVLADTEDDSMEGLLKVARRIERN